MSILVKRTIPLIGLLLLFAVCFAQESNFNVFPGNTDSLQYNYFLERLQIQFDLRRKELKKASRSEKRLIARRAEHRKLFREMIGDLPAKCTLKPNVTWKVDMDSYTIEAITFESLPDHHVTGLFYLPKTGEAPYPAVYIPCGHSSNGKASEVYQRAARLFAMNGFAVLQADPVSQGERYQLLDANGKPKTRGGTLMHEFIGQALLLTGSTVLVHELYDNIRCIDFLERHPMVDKNRIAVTGNSGGGTQTTYLAAYDDRIKVAAPSCYIATAESKFKAPLVPDWCQRLWNEGANGIEEQDFLFMAAPNPIRILSAEEDFFPIVGALEATRELSSLYTILGNPDKLSQSICEGPHGWHRPLREAAVQWCRRWLMNDNRPIIEPEDIGFLSEEESLVTSTGQVLNSFENERSMFDLVEDRVEASRQNRYKFQNGQTQKYIIKKVRELIGFEQPLARPMVKTLGIVREKGYRVEKLLLERDREIGFSLPALLFIPDNVKEKTPATIMVCDKGKSVFLNPESKLFKILDNGHIVLAVDVTNTGELDDRVRETVGKSTVFTPKFALYEGKTLIGYRTEDIVLATRYLRRHKFVDKKKISLSTFGDTGYAALHAAVISRYFNQVEIIGEVKNWDAVATAPYHSPQQLWRLNNIVPDVLNYYDVPDLLSVCVDKNIDVIQLEE